MAAGGKELRPSSKSKTSRQKGENKTKGEVKRFKITGKQTKKPQYCPIWGFEYFSGRNHALYHQASDNQQKRPCWQVARSPPGHRLAVSAGFSLSLSLLLFLSSEMETTNPTCPTECDISTMVKCFVGAKSFVCCKEVISDGNNSFSNQCLILYLETRWLLLDPCTFLCNQTSTYLPTAVFIALKMKSCRELLLIARTSHFSFQAKRFLLVTLESRRLSVSQQLNYKYGYNHTICHYTFFLPGEFVLQSPQQYNNMNNRLSGLP